MDLIGSIKYIESRFGTRKRNPAKDRPVPKNIRNDISNEKNAQADAYPSSTEYNAKLGRMVNITV